MGVSIYVMPLTRYLTGSFRTTWEGKIELAGGEPGFLLTPEGVKDGPPERRRLPVDEVRRYLESLQGEVAFPCESEEGEALSAVSMSYSAFGGVVESAGRHGAGRNLSLVRALGDVFFWLPAEFEGLRELPDPFDDERVIGVASAAGLARGLGVLEECLDRDPRREELESLPEGSLLTGFLFEYYERRETVRLLRRLAGQALDHGLPVIVEG